MAKKITLDIEVNGKMQKATVSVKKLRGALDEVDQAQDKVGKSARTQDRNMKGAARTTSNSTKEFSKMAQGMGGLVGAYATVAASVFALSAAFQFFKTAADLAALTQGQELFAQRTGVSMKLMTSNVQEATGGLVAFKEAAQAVAIGQAAGLTADQLERLGSVAKNAGTILGRDVTDSFNRLTRGAIKAEPELLDELGIIVRIDDAAQNYARTIGKNAKDLTQFEKSQAVVNAVLEQGEQKFQDVGNSVNQVAQFGAAFQDTFKELSEPIAAVANFISGALKDSIIAVGAVMGLLGLSVVKSFAPAMTSTIDLEATAKRARKNITDGVIQGTKKGIAAEIRAGKMTEANLKAVERAFKQKTSKVVNLHKVEEAEIKRSLAIIRADNARTAAENATSFKKMFLNMKADLARFELEYGKGMGRIKAATAAVSSGLNKILKVISGIGIAALIFEIGKEIKRAFLPKNLRDALDAFDDITKAMNEQVEEIRSLRSELVPAANEMEALQQQFGLLTNFNYSKINAAVHELAQTAERAAKALEGQGIDSLSGAINLPQIAVPNMVDADSTMANDSRVHSLAREGIESYEDLTVAIRAASEEVSLLQTAQKQAGQEGNIRDKMEIALLNEELQEAKDNLNSLKKVAEDAGMVTVRDQFGEFATEALAYVDSVRSGLNSMQLQAEIAAETGLDTADFVKGQSAVKKAIAALEAGLDAPGTQENIDGLIKTFESLIRASREVTKEARNIATQSMAQQQAFKGLADGVTEFGTATDVYLPKDSKFQPVFDAFKKIRLNIKTLALSAKDEPIKKLLKTDGQASVTQAQFESLFKVLEKSSDVQDGMVTITETLADGSERTVTAKLEQLTLDQLALVIHREELKLLKEAMGLETRKKQLKFDQNKITETQASFERDLNKAAFDERSKQLKLEEEMMALKNAEMKQQGSINENTATQLAANIALAQQELEIARRKTEFEERMLEFRKNIAELQTENQITNMLKEQLGIREKMVRAQIELARIQRDQEQKAMTENLDNMAANNPFRDMERARAKARLEFEQKTLNARKSEAIREANFKKSQIDIEFKLLDAKRKQTIADMRLLQGQLMRENRFGEAADIANAANALDTIDYGPAKEAALKLNEATLGAKLLDMDRGVRDAQRIVDELDPIEQVFDKSAEAIRTGLGDAINGVFDALVDGSKTASQALKDAFKGVLSTIQKEVTQRLIVDPLLDLIPGKKKDPAAKMQDAHMVGATALKTAVDEGVVSAAEGIQELTAADMQKKAEDLGMAIKEGGDSLADRIKEVLANADISVTPNPLPITAPGGATDGDSAFTRSFPYIARPEGTNPDGSPQESPATKQVLDSLTSGILEPVTVTAEKKDVGSEEGPSLFDSITDAGTEISEKFGDVGGIVAESISGKFGKEGKGIVGGLDQWGSGFLKELAIKLAMDAAKSFLGIGGFRKGGMVSEAYNTGGIARGPKSGYPAVLHGNEAVVPLPDGKTIPVRMQGGGGQQNNVTVNVSIDNQGNAQSSTASDSQDATNVGNLVAAAVQKELQNQKRSGGILNPHGVA
jgi:hypothetical protein